MQVQHEQTFKKIRDAFKAVWASINRTGQEIDDLRSRLASVNDKLAAALLENKNLAAALLENKNEIKIQINQAESRCAAKIKEVEAKCAAMIAASRGEDEGVEDSPDFEDSMSVCSALSQTSHLCDQFKSLGFGINLQLDPLQNIIHLKGDKMQPVDPQRVRSFLGIERCADLEKKWSAAQLKRVARILLDANCTEGRNRTMGNNWNSNAQFVCGCAGIEFQMKRGGGNFKLHGTNEIKYDT